MHEIADAHGIPSRFLVQILLQLKGAGLVQSTGGMGRRLHAARVRRTRFRSPEVMTVIEGPGTLHSNIPVQTPATRALLSIWSEVAATERTMLESTTFGQLAGQSRAGAEEMWHI
jgi:DNA-binding IscR family transcriptional regulator